MSTGEQMSTEGEIENQPTTPIEEVDETEQTESTEVSFLFYYF